MVEQGASLRMTFADAFPQKLNFDLTLRLTLRPNMHKTIDAPIFSPVNHQLHKGLAGTQIPGPGQVVHTV